MRILVVDDSRVMRQIVIRTLRQAGLGGQEVLEAEDGAQALELVQTQSPDLVLSDWNMPTMDGITLLRSLRARGCAVPFGFVTSEGTPEMVDRALATGAQFLVTKPFTAESFREQIDLVLA